MISNHFLPIRGWPWLAVWAGFIAGAPAHAGSPDASSSAASSSPGAGGYGQTLSAVEQRVDASALRIRGTILDVTYAVSAEDDGYLLRIEACDKKRNVGKTIMLVQDKPGLVAGQSWPGHGKTMLVYCVGTTPYMTTKKTRAVARSYVSDRQSAIVWTLSQ